MWPGQFVSVVLTLTTDRHAVVVPAQAVQTGQTGKYVFVVKADDTVESARSSLRAIGRRRPSSTKGSGGERVVIDGQLRLVPGARVGSSRREASP